MKHVVWQPEFETGISFVDSDHRILVRLLNQAIDGMEAREESQVLGSILNGLYCYTEYHFQRELLLQELCKYPDHEAHAEEHRRLQGTVADIRDRFFRDPDSVPFSEVRDLLAQWLVEHILVHDKAFVPYCLDQNEKIQGVSEQSITNDLGSNAAGLDWAGLRILVVEDNRHLSKLIHTLLDIAGIQDIHMTENADDAVDRLRRRPTDLVICDYMMDGATGTEIAGEAFRVDPRTRMLFLSGLEGGVLAAKARDAGVDTVLEKPFTAKGLYGAMGNAVEGAVCPGRR